MNKIKQVASYIVVFRGAGLFSFSVVVFVPCVGFFAFPFFFPLVVLLRVLLVPFSIGGIIADPHVVSRRFFQ